MLFEGNSLALSKTKIVLEYGMTVLGRPLAHLFETLGHGDAFDFMMNEPSSSVTDINEKTIKKLYELFYRLIDFNQADHYRPDSVMINGSSYRSPKSSDLSSHMKHFIIDFNELITSTHPVMLAA
jgi:Fic family protein